MSKDDLAAQLEHSKNNYILGLAACSLFDAGQVYPILDTHMATFGQYFITFDQVSQLLKNEHDREIALREFRKMMIRTLIAEAYGHIKKYCEQTDQYAALKAEPWYEFSRLIRNFLAHNCKFEFNKYDRDRLPISWRDRKITIEMDRQSIELSFFGDVQTWELFQDFTDFVENRLK